MQFHGILFCFYTSNLLEVLLVLDQFFLYFIFILFSLSNIDNYHQFKHYVT